MFHKLLWKHGKLHIWHLLNKFLYINSSNANTVSDMRVRFDNNNHGVDSKAYFDDVIFIDLTETFGAGNEPSQDWCDKHINYFEGTSTIYK